MRPSAIPTCRPGSSPTSCAPTVEHAAALAVSLLGGFRVVADGRELAVPAGRPATLVKLCALSRRVRSRRVGASRRCGPTRRGARAGAGCATCSTALRTACGPLIERDGRPCGWRRASRSTPIAFERAASTRWRPRRRERAGLARTALARYAGELLPADRYAPWAADPRERLQQRYLELLDTLAADARERGDLDEAVRLLERGIAAEPLDEAPPPGGGGAAAAPGPARRRPRAGRPGRRRARGPRTGREPRLERLRAATGRTAIAG